MISINSIDFTPHQVVIIYNVSHSTGLHRTTLEQDFVVKINQSTGKVTGEMHLKDMAPVQSVDEARLKMAEWLERMAASMRAPMEQVVAVPDFRPKEGFHLRPSDQIVFDQICDNIRSGISEKKLQSPVVEEDEMEDCALHLVKDEVDRLIEQGNPITLVPGLRDQLQVVALKIVREQ